MGIRQLPSGSWQVRLRVNGRDLSATFNSRSEAQEWQTVTAAQGIQGTLPSHITVGQYALKWITGYEHSPANTRRFHQINLDQWIVPHLGSRRASSITPTDITTC